MKMHSQYEFMRTWLAFVLLLLAFSGQAVAAVDGQPLRVITSTAILADIARAIGGDAVAVTSLVPNGSNPHSFDPGRTHITALTNADLIIFHGGNAEPWAQRLFTATGSTTPIISVETAIAQPILDDHQQIDPHGWHDLANGGRMAGIICQHLIAADPARTAWYQRRNRAFQSQVQILDAWIRREIAGLPESRRVLVTPQAASAYYAQAYGLTLFSLVSCDAHAEANPRTLAAVAKEMRTHAVPAVFLDGGPHDRLMQTLAEAGNARIGGQLYVDGLGPDASDSNTYFTMMITNTARICQALGQP